MPLGVVIPDGDEDVEVAVQLASGTGLFCPGGGTSRMADSWRGLVRYTRHLNQLLTFDQKGRTMCPARHGAGSSQSFLKPYGLFYPVDVSTANRATIGSMTGNNSWGSPVRYGNMVHNVRRLRLCLLTAVRSISDHQTAACRRLHSRPFTELLDWASARPGNYRSIPRSTARVGGYNIDALIQKQPNFTVF